MKNLTQFQITLLFRFNFEYNKDTLYVHTRKHYAIREYDTCLNSIWKLFFMPFTLWIRNYFNW